MRGIMRRSLISRNQDLLSKSFLEHLSDSLYVESCSRRRDGCLFTSLKSGVQFQEKFNSTTYYDTENANRDNVGRTVLGEWLETFFSGRGFKDRESLLWINGVRGSGKSTALTQLFSFLPPVVKILRIANYALGEPFPLE